MPEAFYVVSGDRVTPTEHTRGPWDAAAQHAGPPAALLGRAIEGCQPRDGFLVARVTFDILRPVPIAPLGLEASVVRPGKNVDQVAAALSDESGRVIMRASAWRIRGNEASETLGQDV